MNWIEAPRVKVSFSGGRTSAMMTKIIIDRRYAAGLLPPVVTFANTGLEDERTLDFVRDCDRYFRFDTVWLEAVVQPGSGNGTRHKVVTFDSASRSGEPFEAVIAKYGIPNRTFQPCNRELKLNTMRSYLRSIGWEAGSYKTAIGIRADEVDRVSSSAMAEGAFYPLISMGIRKPDVLEWWKQQPFDLNLPEHRGNCVTCWKKSDRKLFTLALEDPAAFDFMDRMDRIYSEAGAGDKPRRFFRGKRTVTELIEQARNTVFEPFVDSNYSDPSGLDLGGACGESCEVYADED